MTFSYYESDVPVHYQAAPEKSAQMYERELSQRAGLLKRLGYSRQEIKQRLVGNLRWDFELHQPPIAVSAIDQIIQKTFRS